MKSKKNKTIWVLLGLAVFSTVYYRWIGHPGQSPLPQVQLATVSRGELEAFITSNGKVEPIEPFAIQAKFSAFVEKVGVKEGEAVRAGQLLLALDASEFRADLVRLQEELSLSQEELRVAQAGGRADDLAQIESERSKSEAELARLAREREALNRLASKQAATPLELEQNRLASERVETDLRLLLQKRVELARRAQVAVESATLRTEHGREAIRRLEERIAAARVLAPADGVIYTLPVKAGSYVRTGDLLVELANLGQVRVRAFVDEPELGWLAKDQEVEITWDAYPNRTWSGRLDRLPTAVVARGNRNVGEALCSVDNTNLELLPGVNTNIRIQVRKLADARVVLRAAVRVEGARRFVFLFRDGKLQKRQIGVGASNATRYEVLEGLREGDKVALPGDVELKDGLAVRASELK